MLHQAVACGGAARGFNQGAASPNCAVYATEWLAYKLTDKLDPFTKTIRVTRQFITPAIHFPKLHNNDLAANGQIVIEVADNAPTNEYAKAAEQTKKAWGPTGLQIRIGAVSYLSTLITPRRSTQGPEDGKAPKGADFHAWMLATLTRPGPTMLTLQPSSPGPAHMIATFTTDKEFWLFDSLAGELRLPIDNLPEWYGTPLAQEHFTSRSSVTTNPLVIHE
jgi:hypothetical protein